MFYEKAVEVKSNLELMPNLHILICKGDTDKLYRGFCLERGIVYISSSTILTESIIEEIITNSIERTIELFNRASKGHGLKAFASGRVTNFKFWNIYNYFIIKIKNKTMKENLNKYSTKDLINSYSIKSYNK